jgi:hypothetical protein
MIISTPIGTRTHWNNPSRLRHLIIHFTPRQHIFTREGALPCRKAGAILFVNVPATIITSLCRGLARKIIPNRSWSYRGVDTCIISTAQQASPKVIGHIDPCRAQFTTYIINPDLIWEYGISSSENIIHDTFLWQRRLLYGRWLCWTCDGRDGGVVSLNDGSASTNDRTWHYWGLDERTDLKRLDVHFVNVMGMRLVRKAMVNKTSWSG